MSTGTKRRSCGRILRARKALRLLPAVRMCATSHAMSNFSVPTCPVRLAFVREGARSLYAGQLEPATAFSAGIDLRACLDEDCVRIPAGGRFCVPAGISVQPCEAGFAGFLYSRSGLGAREGLTVAQGVGVIDPDYTGEILVMLLNTSGAHGPACFPALCPPCLAGGGEPFCHGARCGRLRTYGALVSARGCRRPGPCVAACAAGHACRRAGTSVFPAGLPFFPKPFLFHDCRGACPVGWRKASQQRS